MEGVYAEALDVELSLHAIPFVTESELQVDYRGSPLKQTFRADVVCFSKIIVELKATDRLIDEHRAQLFNYLSATQFRLGLLINFGHKEKLEWERIAR